MSENRTRSVFGSSTLVPFPDTVIQLKVRFLDVQLSDVNLGTKKLDYFMNIFFLYIKRSRLVLHPKSKQIHSNFGRLPTQP